MVKIIQFPHIKDINKNVNNLMISQAARVTEKVPLRWIFIIRFQSRSVIFMKETSLRIPALLMITSTFPKASTAVLTILSPNSTESVFATAIPPAALI